MTNHTLVATWIKRFLQGYLISDRNLSANTQHSYRDTICLLVPFIARQARKTNEKIEVEDITAERIKRFLLDLEQSRHCSISTRNQRLAAIHSLAKFIGLHSPEHLQWCGQIHAIPFKKASHKMITYLEQGRDGCVIEGFGRFCHNSAVIMRFFFFFTILERVQMKPLSLPLLILT